MTICFDDTGNRYELPDYVLSNPTDMNEDLRTNLRSNDDNRVTSPPPWTRGDDQRFSNDELPRTRDEFWRMISDRDDGRVTEVFLKALREAAECQALDRKQQIIDTNNIRLGNRDMTICFDDTGNRYELPDYVLSDPTDMNELDLRKNKRGISPCSIL
ncbi:ubiquitin domain-containing protein 1-like [Helianthus annuus]|uniref:ubiquitin domain-containing protein 1-like n=1 Tax=Helianthus annuus TaxID=4232 RepID=UPI001652E29D|nr:ubiquitin domain-containing protein 1-like [Helianthus annuus]